ncbi:hypothetical protein J2T55_001521 [Methylohalomonas lacus]|uniref:Uncharacterized protein n=1 Tax=Methylohalomonas lacus TaxID=398773 RepID=A0AAE3HJL9_9GAMM|nr:hypothetical protein [Methylohalomonas lacus]
MLVEPDMTQRQLFENYGKITKFDKRGRDSANLPRHNQSNLNNYRVH